MQEQLVSFETAKLAKEKGFDVPVKAMYYNEEFIYCGADYNHNNEEEQKLWNCLKLSAPEQWMVVEWLRVNHGIFVRINPTIIEYNNSKDDIKWSFDVFNLKTYLKNGKVWGTEDMGMYNNNTYYETLQEAYSAAFDYILNNDLI